MRRYHVQKRVSSHAPTLSNQTKAAMTGKAPYNATCMLPGSLQWPGGQTGQCNSHAADGQRLQERAADFLLSCTIVKYNYLNLFDMVRAGPLCFSNGRQRTHKLHEGMVGAGVGLGMGWPSLCAEHLQPRQRGCCCLLWLNPTGNIHVPVGHVGSPACWMGTCLPLPTPIYPPLYLRSTAAGALNHRKQGMQSSVRDERRGLLK